MNDTILDHICDPEGECSQILELLYDIEWRLSRLETHMGVQVENEIIDLLPSKYKSRNREL